MCTGIISTPATVINNSFFPMNLYRAKAYPTIRQKIAFPAVTAVPTIAELMIDLPKFFTDRIDLKLSSVIEYPERFFHSEPESKLSENAPNSIHQSGRSIPIRTVSIRIHRIQLATVRFTPLCSFPL